MRIGEKFGQEVSKDKGSAGFCNARRYGSPTGRVTFTQVPKYSRMYSVIEALLTIICLLLFNIYRFDIKFFFFFFLTVLGLHCFARAFFSCSQQGLLSSCGAQASHCSSFSR